MTTIVPPPITAAVALGPISQILPAQYRFAGDDWDDEAAFLFTFYTVLPIFDANGNVVTAGTVRDLTGCTFSGSVEFAAPANPFKVPLIWDAAPTAMVGAINLSAGQGSLTLASAQTQFRRQPLALWQPDRQGFKRDAAMVVRARITDPYQATTTAGIVPLFVF